jgi:uncharacterized protein involved in cysteine biosynthesis
VVPVIGALFGGWFLAVELTGMPFTRRGLRLRDRRRILATRRPMAVGFGAAVFLCFLIPLGAVLIMPAASEAAASTGRFIATAVLRFSRHVVSCVLDILAAVCRPVRQSRLRLAACPPAG